MARKLNEIQLMLDGTDFLHQFASDLRKDVKGLGGDDGMTYDAIKSDSKLRKEFAKLIVSRRNAKIGNKFLTIISGDEKIVIDAVNGTEILAKANDMFSYTDSDFVNYGADEPGSATEKAPVMVYEMTKNATFTQMFGSLNTNLDKLCLTQAQIKSFVQKHRDKLRTDGYGTFFLFKSGRNFFVAIVMVYSGGTLGVNVRRFEGGGGWDAGSRRRVVVPQLAV